MIINYYFIDQEGNDGTEENRFKKILNCHQFKQESSNSDTKNQFLSGLLRYLTGHTSIVIVNIFPSNKEIFSPSEKQLKSPCLNWKNTKV